MSDPKMSVEVAPANESAEGLAHVEAVVNTLMERLPEADPFAAVGILISSIMMLAASAPPDMRVVFGEMCKTSLAIGLETQLAAMAEHEGSGEVRH